MNELVEDLRELFQNQEARYAYADATLNAYVAAQIKALRDARKMNQQELADAIGTKQSGISRLENVNYSSWNVGTLRKLARAFKVRLRISFEEFGSLLTELENLRIHLIPRQFEEDPVFGKSVEEPEDTQLEPLSPEDEEKVRNLIESQPNQDEMAESPPPSSLDASLLNLDRQRSGGELERIHKMGPRKELEIKPQGVVASATS